MEKFHLVRPEGAVWDWLTNWLVTERLGLAFCQTIGSDSQVTLQRDGRTLTFPAHAGKLMKNWAARAGQGPIRETQRLTARDCVIWPEKMVHLPVIADNRPQVKVTEKSVHISFDPLALAALLLSGAEEILDPLRDRHERYVGAQSISVREGWIDRPVLDETVALIRALINYLWPDAIKRPGPGNMQVSCDIDQPFSPNLRQPYQLIRSIGGDLINRRDFGLALRRTIGGIFTPFGLPYLDISYTFDRFMDVLEQHGQRAQFYIISGNSAGSIDGCYDLFEPRMKSLLSRLVERRHVLGMHGSYNTFRNLKQIALERDNLMNAIADVGITSLEHGRGNRQHFLRWDMARTPYYLQMAGFNFDSSGGYADVAGFRFGTANEFSMWDWQRGRALTLRQKPLIAMECSIISDRYMGLGYSPEAYTAFEVLQDRAMAHGGTFTLLWHNSHFMKENDWQLFEYLVKRGSQIRAGTAIP